MYTDSPGDKVGTSGAFRGLDLLTTVVDGSSNSSLDPREGKKSLVQMERVGK